MGVAPVGEPNWEGGCVGLGAGRRGATEAGRKKRPAVGWGGQVSRAARRGLAEGPGGGVGWSARLPAAGSQGVWRGRAEARRAAAAQGAWTAGGLCVALGFTWGE